MEAVCGRECSVLVEYFCEGKKIIKHNIFNTKNKGMNDQLLTTYSFFAALTENGTDIYSAVYIPICKRALSLYANNKTAGDDTNIRDIILSEYGVNVPLLIVRKLIKSVVKDLSRKDKNKFDFHIYENRNSFSFSFKSFSFNDIEDAYQAERRKSNALQKAFEAFCKSQSEDLENIPTFYEFINKNKNKISSFLSGKVSDVSCPDVSFMPHVQFLKYIEQNDDTLYKVTKQIFIGSVIASYLESDFDLSAKLQRGITYYLDTQIVLELLDLQRAEDAVPIRELVKLIQDTGGNIRLLDITLDEIKTNIDTAIRNYDKNNPSTTINEACVRSGNNKTWLISLHGKLEKILQSDYNINIEKIPDSDIEQFNKTEDAEALISTRFRKHSALHDVAAYLYVREKRKKDANKNLLQKTSCWFVTANKSLCDFNALRKVGHYRELVMPGELTSLLFLQNPQKLSDRISSIGLNELIAQTLSEEYPSRDLINEFDHAVSSLPTVSEEDYKILLSAISNESALNIQKLLDGSISKPKQFDKDVHAIIEKERKKKLDSDNKHKSVLQKNKGLEEDNARLSTQISELSKQVADVQEQQEKDRSQFEERKKIQKRREWAYRGVFIVLVMVILLLIFPNITEWLRSVLKTIAGLSGLWAFLNFILNVLKIR